MVVRTWLNFTLYVQYIACLVFIHLWMVYPAASKLCNIKWLDKSELEKYAEKNGLA